MIQGRGDQLPNPLGFSRRARVDRRFPPQAQASWSEKRGRQGAASKHCQEGHQTASHVSSTCSGSQKLLCDGGCSSTLSQSQDSDTHEAATWKCSDEAISHLGDLGFGGPPHRDLRAQDARCSSGLRSPRLLPRPADWAPGAGWLALLAARQATCPAAWEPVLIAVENTVHGQHTCWAWVVTWMQAVGRQEVSEGRHGRGEIPRATENRSASASHQLPAPDGRFH